MKRREGGRLGSDKKVQEISATSLAVRVTEITRSEVGKCHAEYLERLQAAHKKEEEIRQHHSTPTPRVARSTFALPPPPTYPLSSFGNANSQGVSEPLTSATFTTTSISPTTTPTATLSRAEKHHQRQLEHLRRKKEMENQLQRMREREQRLRAQTILPTVASVDSLHPVVMATPLVVSAASKRQLQRRQKKREKAAQRRARTVLSYPLPLDSTSLPL